MPTDKRLDQKYAELAEKMMGLREKSRLSQDGDFYLDWVAAEALVTQLGSLIAEVPPVPVVETVSRGCRIIEFDDEDL
jgi:hypothetical protein